MILSEGYLHFVADDESPPALREVGAIAFPVVEQAARQFLVDFATTRQAEVVVEEATIRLRGIIRMTVAGLIGYGGLRQAIEYARSDGIAAAGWINEHLGTHLDLRRRRIIARRRFTPAPTRLQRLFDGVAAGELSPEEATERAEEMFREYRETTDAIRRVMPYFRDQFASVASEPRPRRRRKRSGREEHDHAVALPGRRISIFRDRDGSLRFVESQ